MGSVRDFIVRAALIVGLLLPVYFLVAALGTKFGLLPWTIGFGLMTFIVGPPLLLGAAALGIVALLLAAFVSPRRGVAAALVGLIVPVLGLGYAAYVRQNAMDIPPIHDISTDLVDPPSFSASVAQARAAVPAGNGLDLLDKRTEDGRRFVDLQREAYADIQPATTRLAPSRAFDIALESAREQGWTIGHTDPEAGVIEATATTFWYGFTDDIVVRVRPEGEGVRIDVRSVSRVGRSDLGANAARLRPYLDDLRARLERAEMAG